MERERYMQRGRNRQSKRKMATNESHLPCAVRSRKYETFARRGVLWLALAGLTALAPLCQTAPPVDLPFERTEVRSDCTDFDAHRQPFFGDTHVHTYHSLDADLRGTRTLPSDSYAFAQGQTIGIQPFDAFGDPLQMVTIDRPLDFAIVTDHSEYFGELSICRTPGLVGYNSQACVYYRTDPSAAEITFLNVQIQQPANVSRQTWCGVDGQHCVDESITLWTEIQDAAEGAYDRTAACGFTTFVGYEWTGAPGFGNLHRNVIFRNADVPTHVTSYLDEPYAEGLWDRLEQDCLQSATDCDVLTIRHNSNLGNGMAFQTIDRDGNPFDTAYAQRRASLEPLIEIMQHKGSSECLPAGSSADELCDFEVVPWNNVAAVAAFGDPYPRDYVRGALLEGLAQEQQLGANPFRYGIVGSTDNHLGTPGLVEESVDVPDPGGGDPDTPGQPRVGLSIRPAYNPGGLAVVWAEENSRDSLFEAMRRRETYATSGTRPIVRFFAGWKYPLDLCDQNDVLLKADNMGVPMGAELKPRLGDWTPKIYVSALKDPGTVSRPGSDLQRIQIIKGWVDGTGDVHEQTYDVAGDPDNGADVDLDTCAPIGSGFDALCTVWEDPDFDPDAGAFYYARVVENPVCRWSQLQCNAAAVDCDVPATITAGFEACCDGSIPATVQERAWTSPVWYRPN